MSKQESPDNAVEMSIYVDATQLLDIITEFHLSQMSTENVTRFVALLEQELLNRMTKGTKN